MYVHFLELLDKICTMDKLSQWNRILRESRDAAQVLTAAVMAKRSLKVIEWKGGRRVREGRVDPVACARGTTARLACVCVKIQEGGCCLFVVIEEVTTIPEWEENSPQQEVLVEDVFQSKVMGRMVSSAEDIQHAA